MRKIFISLLVLTTVFIVLTACNKTNVQQLSTDKKTNNLQQENSYIPLPSNKEQNNQKRNNDPEVVSYAEDYAQFLEQMSFELDHIGDIFRQANFSDDNINQMKNHVKKVRQLVEEIDKKETPKPFQNYQAIHDTVLIEVRLLDEILQNNDLNDSKTARLARVYFENIVSYHRSMHVEYRIITSELGIY